MNPAKEILKRRAEALATLPPKEPGAAIQTVEFVLHPEHYAIETSYIREVLTLKDLTHIPGTPTFIMGVILFRGKILSVLNLKNLFGIREQGLTEFNKILVIGNKDMEFGIVSDKICHQRSFEIATISNKPMNFINNQIDFIKGIANDGTILLDAEKMLGNNSLIVSQ